MSPVRTSRPGSVAAVGRDGFTLVEILLVVAVVSIVIRIAVPNVQHVLTQARAVEVLAQVSSVRSAAHEHLAEHHTLPDDAPPGSLPDELRPYLGPSFTFQGEGYTLDWESWTLPSGLPGDPDVNQLAGVTVTADDENLIDALRGLTGKGAWFALGDSYTFLISPD